MATANALAYLRAQTQPISVLLGLSHRNLMRQSPRCFLLGEGEAGLMVYTIPQGRSSGVLSAKVASFRIDRRRHHRRIIQADLIPIRG